MAGVVQQFIEFEALVDLLVEHDVVPSQADLEEAESQLVGNGFEPDSPVLERLTTWQSGFKPRNQLGPEESNRAMKRIHIERHETCTSHILVSSRSEANDLMGSLR